MLGTAIDPFSPAATSEDLLRNADLAHVASGDLIEATSKWTGRWVVIVATPNHQTILTDPCGLRQVHYYKGGRDFWCGSQPEILRTQVHLDADSAVTAFVQSKAFRHRDNAFVGDRTPYRECFALLPNHALDIRTREAHRVFPSSHLKPVSAKTAVDTAARILRGGIEGIVQRGPVSLAVTAGYDSRTILAASQPFLRDIHCFVDRKGTMSNDHVDIATATKLAKQLEFELTVENSDARPTDEFMRQLAQNVTCARGVSPKTRMIYSKYSNESPRTNINGNGSEICRSFFDSHLNKARRSFSPAELARQIGYHENEFAIQQLQQWKEGLGATLSYGFGCLDMLYWEQKMGRWGALYPAEQDIAVDEFSPFNNRLLITTLLGVPAKLRCAPRYVLYRSIIDALWPEVAGEVFNKKTLVETLRAFSLRVYSDYWWPLRMSLQR